MLPKMLVVVLLMLSSVGCQAHATPVSIRPAHTGKCLEVQNASLEAGASVAQATCADLSYNQFEGTGLVPDSGNPSEIPLTSHGAVGDGVSDDTVAVQLALTQCSNEGLICRVPRGHTFLITRPIYMWGGASLLGEDGTGTMHFTAPDPFLFMIGISGVNIKEIPWFGTVKHVRFVVTSVGAAATGRLFFFFRTQFATLTQNAFYMGESTYSATSSHNANQVLSGIPNYVRKDITITHNRIEVRRGPNGSEGFGLQDFDGALIAHNTILGTADDAIGIHQCFNIKILHNTLETRGRLYVSNSRNVEIGHNRITRGVSRSDGVFHESIALIYIGYELFRNTAYAPPTQIWIHDNYLQYLPGAIDGGAAISLLGARDTLVRNNTIVNDSSLVTAWAIRLAPQPMTNWADPTGVDPRDLARVHATVIDNNKAIGAYPQEMVNHGICRIGFVGPIVQTNNLAKAYNFVCGPGKIRDNATHSLQGTSKNP